MSTSRNRGFCFTINNYVDTTIEAIRIAPDNVYIIVGKEIGESGTRHLQGYIHFSKPKTLRQVRGYIQGHIEVRRGSVPQAIDYCKKDGDYVEIGTPPLSDGDASKIAWASILEKAKAGDYEWIESSYPKVWIQLSSNLQSLRTREINIIDGPLEHEWWYGPTGTGKSRLVWELYPNHYQKELNKWWCGFEDQSVVVIEEWSPKNECTGSQLKIWADRYPFTGQIKGGSLKSIRPLKIIVLSNFTIDQCFLDERDNNPLKRRFKQVAFPISSLQLACMRSSALRYTSPASSTESVSSEYCRTNDLHVAISEARNSLPEVPTTPTPSPTQSTSNAELASRFGNDPFFTWLGSDERVEDSEDFTS